MAYSSAVIDHHQNPRTVGSLERVARELVGG